MNEEWKNNVGTGSTVKWPIGLAVKVTTVSPRSFSVCRVQLVMLNMLTRSSNLAYTKLISADGKPVSPTENFANAAKGADWSKTFARMTNQKGEDAWPITSTTFILIHKDSEETRTRHRSAEILRLGVQNRG